MFVVQEKKHGSETTMYTMSVVKTVRPVTSGLIVELMSEQSLTRKCTVDVYTETITPVIDVYQRCRKSGFLPSEISQTEIKRFTIWFVDPVTVVIFILLQVVLIITVSYSYWNSRQEIHLTGTGKSRDISSSTPTCQQCLVTCGNQSLITFIFTQSGSLNPFDTLNS